MCSDLKLLLWSPCGHYYIGERGRIEAGRSSQRSGHFPLDGVLVTQSCLTLLWAVARQAPLCIGFFRQEYWSGLPFPSPGDLPNPGIELGVQLNIEPGSPALQVGSLPSESPGKTLDCGSSSVSSEK